MIQQCLTTKTILTREMPEVLTAPLLPSEISRRAAIACSRDSPVRLLNTPLPSQESMDPLKPPLLELKSSPIKNMRILGQLDLPHTSLLWLKKSTKLLILMRMSSYTAFFLTEILSKILNYPRMMRKPTNNLEKLGMREEILLSTSLFKRLLERKNSSQPELNDLNETSLIIFIFMNTFSKPYLLN